jgi:putative transposase
MNSVTPQKKRFPGLRLTPEDLLKIDKKCKDKSQPALLWRRAKILQLLNNGWKLINVGKALGTYSREVRRIGWRYLNFGLEKALSDEPRKKESKMLDHRQVSAIVAMVCARPPDGYARWTIKLITAEVMKRGIVHKVGRETVRQVLKSHELKPWREKNVVRGKNR